MTWAALLVAALAVWAAVRAFLIEPNDVELSYVSIPLPDLDPRLDGLRIVHLSDLHMERCDVKERKVVAAVREVRPDLVCFTGDFVPDTRSLSVLAPYLMEIVGGRPAFAVLGNHDHQPNVDLRALVSTLERSAVKVLINDRAKANIRGAWIDVIGVDDPHRGRDDLDKALDRTDRPRLAVRGEDRGFVLLLAHSPDIALQDRAKEADLILCGHTHGGQFRFPVVGPLKTNTRIGRKAVAGFAVVNGARVYVTRGIGETKVRARFRCRPEATVIVLRRSASLASGSRTSP